MVVCDSEQQALVEVGNEMPLCSGPHGFYKLVEIGVNNYDPQIFMKQTFTIYFFKKDPFTDPDVGMLERELMRTRIEHQLVAVGTIEAADLISNSVNQDDFVSVEPSLTQGGKRNQDESQMKVNLYSKDKTQNIGLISLKQI
jgi:hypothetical protein